MLCGGAGGAGIGNLQPGFVGGKISLQAAMDLQDGTLMPSIGFIPGGVPANGTTIINGGNGNPGYNRIKPLLFTGGSGGGSSDLGNGGVGGMGGYGCGGGGGGGGIVGGGGGRGGDGIVIIISW
jgi:hypothetical protein